MKRTFPAAACLLLAAAPLAHADRADIKARQQIMKEWAGINKQMGRMIKSAQADKFPQTDFARLAAELKQTADEPWKHFTAGTQRRSDALETVWTQPAAFQAAVKDFTSAVNALDAAARSGGGLNAVKVPYEKMSQSCKACHKQFKD
ncbi:cytochrome c556 [Neisseria sp. HSC-16F19]|nr:cytochrome c [Neisseria sp. HSC-16F19]MCP2039798.1 cytochrome c556 [Neisseria sp. HSC-16F19]